MLGMFVVVGNIILLNLLIAMMGSTYDDIKETSREEWIMDRTAPARVACARRGVCLAHWRL